MDDHKGIKDKGADRRLRVKERGKSTWAPRRDDLRHKHDHFSAEVENLSFPDSVAI